MLHERLHMPLSNAWWLFMACTSHALVPVSVTVPVHVHVHVPVPVHVLLHVDAHAHAHVWRLSRLG